MESRRCTATSIGPAPVLFTAPHAIYLYRDNAEVHKPEDLTGFLAEDFAASLGGSALMWSREVVSSSARTSQPQPEHRDPNYLRTDELAENPWNAALRELLHRWPPWSCLHVDVHGRRDYHAGINDESCDASDVDCGLGALRACGPPSLLATVERAAAHYLGAALASTSFVLNLRPRLTGAATAGRWTVSQQSVRCGAVGVQLELSLRLRRALHADDRLRHRFASALAAIGRTVASAAADGAFGTFAAGLTATEAAAEPADVMMEGDAVDAMPRVAAAAATAATAAADGDGSEAASADADADADAATADAASAHGCSSSADVPPPPPPPPRFALFVFAHPLEVLGTARSLRGVAASLPEHSRAFVACTHQCAAPAPF